MTKLGACAAAIGVFAALRGSTLPARADQSSAIVRPLREIGHVRATSSFCRAFSEGATPAAAAAIAFENRLLVTGADLAAFDASDELAKHRTVRTLEDDIHALADDATAGRAELASLRERAIASGTNADLAVARFADALSGAQGRQMEIARTIARTVGTLEEVEVSNIVKGPQDGQYASVFARSGRTPSALLAPAIDGLAPSPYERDFFSLPGDERVGDDLARAVQHAREAETLENCLSSGDGL